MGKKFYVIMLTNFPLTNSNMIKSNNIEDTINIRSQDQYHRVVTSRALTFKVGCGKMKTRKSAAKRFKVTGSGRVIRRQCGKQHLNEKKSRNRKNGLSTYKKVSESDMAHVIKCLPYMLK